MWAFNQPLPPQDHTKIKYKCKTLLLTNLWFVLHFMLSKNLCKQYFKAIFCGSFLIQPSMSPSCLPQLVWVTWITSLSPVTISFRPPILPLVQACSFHIWWPWSRTFSFNPLYTLLWNSSSLNTASPFINTRSRLSGTLSQNSGHCLILQTCYIHLTWTLIASQTSSFIISCVHLTYSQNQDRPAYVTMVLSVAWNLWRKVILVMEWRDNYIGASDIPTYR